MNFNEFIEVLDTKILHNSKTTFPIGSNIRIIKLLIGRFSLRISTGTTKELPLVSVPSIPTLPLSKYEIIFVSFSLLDSLSKNFFLPIISKSAVWSKFKIDRLSYSANLNLQEFHELYQYMIKTTKYEVLL